MHPVFPLICGQGERLGAKCGGKSGNSFTGAGYRLRLTMVAAD